MRAWYNKHFLFGEFVISILAVVGCRIVPRWVPALGSIWTGLAGNHTSLYGTLTGLTGAMLGFIITALSIVLVLGPQSQFHLLRASGQMGTLFSVFSQAIAWLAAATVWSLVGLLFAVEGPVGSVVATGALWLTILAGLRVYRCVWALRHVIEIALLPAPGDASR